MDEDLKLSKPQLAGGTASTAPRAMELRLSSRLLVRAPGRSRHQPPATGDLTRMLHPPGWSGATQPSRGPAPYPFPPRSPGQRGFPRPPDGARDTPGDLRPHACAVGSPQQLQGSPSQQTGPQATSITATYYTQHWRYCKCELFPENEMSLSASQRLLS